MAKLFANSGDPDQMPHSAASDLGLHCLPITLLAVSRPQCQKGCKTPDLHPHCIPLQANLAHDCTALHCIESLIITLSSSQYDLNTLQPLYNMVCYNTVLDITRFKDGSQNV